MSIEKMKIPGDEVLTDPYLRQPATMGALIENRKKMNELIDQINTWKDAGVKLKTKIAEEQAVSGGEQPLTQFEKNQEQAESGNSFLDRAKKKLTGRPDQQL